MWSFDPHNSSSWRQSEEVLEHVQCMLVHLGEGGGEGSGKGERKKQTKAEVKIRASIRRKLAVLLTNVGSYLAHALSRFEAAQKLLEAAVWQLRDLMSTCTTSDCFDDDGFFLVSEDFSSALHVLGRVLRYGGKLDLAESVLTEALRLRQSAASACTESREPSSHIADIADTLHELGVLYLRIGKHKLAQQNLEESLRLRRVSRIENNKKTLRTTEAATLHQLAVVATAGKHYDVAEKV
jgi:tetratricopeptide (TPR) repeat protein